MSKRRTTWLLVALAFAAVAPAHAASIALQPSAALVPQTQDFTLSLLINASDAPGTHPGLHGGEVIIDFDPALISYNAGSLALQSGVSFFQPLSIGSSGGRQTLSFGFDNAPDAGTVATMTFKATGPLSSIATLGIADADDFAGSFASYVPTYQRFYPDFSGTSVQIVPLPGAAWFMLTAFGVVASRARRAGKASRPAR